MPDEPKVGCARPTGGPVTGDAAPEADAATVPQREETRSMIQVGRPAPDFEAPAYHQGAFTSVKLGDHLGKWVVLCFYPGDFTFV